MIGKREVARLERRANIIAVARQHFFEHGYSGTNMSAIAAKLGGSKGTLWSYFPSKEDLFAAVIEDTAAGIRSHIDVSGPKDDPVELLRRLARSIIDRALSPIVLSMFRLIASEVDRQPHIGEIFYERGPRSTQFMIRDFLKDNLADILWTTDYLEAGKTLFALSAAAIQIEQMWGREGAMTVKERDATAHRAALLFLRAYGKDPSRFGLFDDSSGAVG